MPPATRSPSNSSDLRVLLLSTPAPAVFTGPDGGKTAYHMLRWVSTRGDALPAVLNGR